METPASRWWNLLAPVILLFIWEQSGQTFFLVPTCSPISVFSGGFFSPQCSLLYRRIKGQELTGPISFFHYTLFLPNTKLVWPESRSRSKSWEKHLWSLPVLQADLTWALTFWKRGKELVWYGCLVAWKSCVYEDPCNPK